jgi:hypothetical protein
VGSVKYDIQIWVRVSIMILRADARHITHLPHKQTNNINMDRIREKDSIWIPSFGYFSVGLAEADFF